MPQPNLDFWFDFASTYSYPAAMRVAPLAHAAGVTVRFRPFLLGPIFKAQGWDNSPFNVYAAKGRYMWRDMERLCADLGLAFRRPDPFPQPSLMAARLALALDDGAPRADFCRAVFHAQFAEGQPISDEAVLGTLLKAQGQEPAHVFVRARSDEVKAALRAETETAQALGIFGAPTFVTAGGELFWGNDRLEQALTWAKRA